MFRGFREWIISGTFYAVIYQQRGTKGITCTRFTINDGLWRKFNAKCVFSSFRMLKIYYRNFPIARVKCGRDLQTLYRVNDHMLDYIRV
jgi:hypothetical protein